MRASPSEGREAWRNPVRPGGTPSGLEEPRQTWRNPDVGEDAELLGSPREQHSVIRCLEDERHPNVHAALLDLQRGRSHLWSGDVFDGTEGGPLAADRAASDGLFAGEEAWQQGMI